MESYDLGPLLEDLQAVNAFPLPTINPDIARSMEVESYVEVAGACKLLGEIPIDCDLIATKIFTSLIGFVKEEPYDAVILLTLKTLLVDFRGELRSMAIQFLEGALLLQTPTAFAEPKLWRFADSVIAGLSSACSEDHEKELCDSIGSLLEKCRPSGR